MRRFLAAIMLIGVLSTPACVSSEVKTQIATTAATGDGNLKDWGKLTDLQKYQVYWSSTRAHHDYDYAINGKAVPPAFVGRQAKNVTPENGLVAPVTTEAK